MVKSKQTVESDNRRKIFSIMCVGECGRGVEVGLDPGMVFRQINLICSSCSKETKYAIPKATASKFHGLPPGQDTLDGE